MGCCKKKNKNVEKSRKPTDSKFHQQKLPAWQPLLTAGTVFPIFYSIGLIFIPIGAILLVVYNGMSEVSFDYTDCSPEGDQSSCAALISTQISKGIQYPICKCRVVLNLTQNYQGDVNLYYGLTNFYQNHRRYVKSRDDNQLKGTATDNLNTDCEPYRSTIVNNSTKWYAPCGAIANSKFNDTYVLSYIFSNGSLVQVPLSAKGIAWQTDVNVKFGTPSNSTWVNTVKPPNWPQSIQEKNGGSYQLDEDLIVWMRTAALPNFRKLHRRLKREAEFFKDGLPAGSYQVDITYSFPVKNFSGTKSIILSTTSWMGGKNPTLGIAYLVVGIIHIILGVVFTVIHVKVTKKSTSVVLNAE